MIEFFLIFGLIAFVFWVSNGISEYDAKRSINKIRQELKKYDK